MTRVFWDTMLFVYLIEQHGTFGPVVQSLYSRSCVRQDRLMTSYLAIAEVLVGLKESGPTFSEVIRLVEEMGFELVEFGKDSVDAFVRLRRDASLKAPDAMNLACAASANVNLFLTGDQELQRKRLHLAGINFIADFENAPL